MEIDLYADKEKRMIHSNKKYFESSIRVAEKLFKQGLYEDCINYIEKTASFGWFNFSGYYKSEQLERLLFKIQQKILPSSSHSKKNIKTNKILHICSEIYTSGGHSKLLYNWIKNDGSKKHTILSTRLSIDEVTEISKFYLPDFQELDHVSIKNSSKIKCAELLNNQPLNDYDLIVLHIHPDETITNIVLSQKEITTPVCFVNHADHVFWLGISIADLVLQIRSSNIPIDEERRGISTERQFFLPIPIENSYNINDKKTEVRKNFVNLLSTGTAYKYNPNDHYDFLREAHKVVEENPDVIFNIVGINSDSEYAKKNQHERIYLHGIVSSEKLAEIEEITDIYVEGFPMASFTALLQVALRKTSFVLHYNPLPLFKLFENNIQYNINYPKNLEEWHAELKKLIQNQQYREETAKKQYSYILENFSIQIWKSRVQEVYDLLEKKFHVFWDSKADMFYDSDNEKLLVTIDRKRFHHYSFTENMSLAGKYFVYKISKSRNNNITYFDKKELLKYFLNNNG